MPGLLKRMIGLFTVFRVAPVAKLSTRRVRSGSINVPLDTPNTDPFAKSNADVVALDQRLVRGISDSIKWGRGSRFHTRRSGLEISGIHVAEELGRKRLLWQHA